jgi:Flp pilus assembly protein TadG
MRKLFSFFTGLNRTRFAAKRFKGPMDETGSAIVEMALSSSVLFAMFFGMFEMSMASYTYHYVSDAAREGSRYAVVRGSTSCHNTGLTGCGATSDTIATYVKALPYPGINPSNMTVTTTWYKPSAGTPTAWTLCSTGTCNAPGYLVKVNVLYAFPLSVPFIPARTINVTSTSQMVISQ